jgi:phosphoribosylformylglycinamidine synthase
MTRATSVLVLRAAGINCDRELVHAFQLAGATQVDLVHVRRLAEQPKLLERYGIVAVPGGFSYGDDVAAGRILATELAARLGSPLADFLAGGGLAFGVCNGFQVLVGMGLLPGLPEDGGRPAASLATNDGGLFVDAWVRVQTAPSVCAWAPPAGARLELPVAHAEGKFVTTPDRLARLQAAQQVVFRYADGTNPNGSLDDIAGITDPTGRVLGLMPHPERHVLGLQHPRWTREGLREAGDGLVVFQRGLAAAREALV